MADLAFVGSPSFGTSAVAAGTHGPGQNGTDNLAVGTGTVKADGLDAYSTGILNIGAANATAIQFGATVYLTDIDTASGVPLNIGTTNATDVNIGRSGQTVAVGGSLTVAQNFTVSGTTTTINSTTMTVDDNLIVVNSGPAATGYDAGLLAGRYQVDNDTGAGDVVGDTAAESGTAQAGAATTITLAAGASAVDDYYNGWWIKITNDTPAGILNQVRQITDYVGSTRIATVSSAWTTVTPGASTTYSLYNRVFMGTFYDTSTDTWVWAATAQDPGQAGVVISSYLDVRMESADLGGASSNRDRDATLNFHSGNGAAALDKSLILDYDAGRFEFDDDLHITGTLQSTGALTVDSGGAQIDGGLTLTTTGITMTGLDIGGTAAEIGDIYSDGYFRMGESSTPSNVTDKGFLYSKADATGTASTELFYFSDDSASGQEVQLTYKGELGPLSIVAGTSPAYRTVQDMQDTFHSSGWFSGGVASIESESDTAQGGAASTITLASGANASDDYYNNWTIEITGGTGSGQTRTISDYVGATKIATVSVAWTTPPDGTSTYTVTSNDSVDVTAGEGTIRATDSRTAELLFTTWTAGSALSVPSNTIRYLGVEYNAGAPRVNVFTAEDWDYNTEFPLATAVNESGTIHIVQNEQAVGDHANFMIQRAYETAPLARDDRSGGLIISGVGARNIEVTAGALWDRLNRFAISAIDTSGAGDFTTYYRVGGVWTATTGVTQWPNTQYNNTATGLVAMTPSYYSNLWFYIELDGALVMVYDTAEYDSLAGAEAASPPGTVPLRVQAHGKLIGRVIFQNNGAAPTEVQSVFTEVFSAAAAADHGNLAGLGDDDHTQYVIIGGTTARNTLTGDGILADDGAKFVVGTDSDAQFYSSGGHGILEGVSDGAANLYIRASASTTGAGANTYVDAGDGNTSANDGTLYLGNQHTSSIVYGSSASATQLMYIPDNNASALFIQQGASTYYLNIDTTDADESIAMGNSITAVNITAGKDSSFVTVNGTASAIDGANLTFTGGSGYVASGGAGGAGGALSFTSGAGGDGAAGEGGAGTPGDITLTSGAGGAGTTTAPPTGGAAITITTGAGGASGGFSEDGADGGAVTITGGAGGAGVAGQTGGTGGSFTLRGGPPGAAGGGTVGTGGAAYVYGGTANLASSTGGAAYVYGGAGLQTNTVAGHAYVKGGDGISNLSATPGNAYVMGGEVTGSSSGTAGNAYVRGGPLGALASGTLGSLYLGDDHTSAIQLGGSVDLPRPITTVYGHLKMEAYQVPETGTAQGPGTGNNQIKLAAGASGVNDYYNGWTIDITGGLGSGQSKIIIDYVGGTTTATVDSDWTTNPDATSVYLLRYDCGIKVPTVAAVPARTDAFMETGDLVYDSANDDLYAYTGAAWQKIGGATAAETLAATYNAGGNAAAQTLTINSATKGGPVLVKTDDATTTGMRFDDSLQLDFGTSGNSFIFYNNAIHIKTKSAEATSVDINLTVGDSTTGQSGTVNITGGGSTAGGAPGGVKINGGGGSVDGGEVEINGGEKGSGVDGDVHIGKSHTKKIKYGNSASALHQMYLDSASAEALKITKGVSTDWWVFDASSDLVTHSVDSKLEDDFELQLGTTPAAALSYSTTEGAGLLKGIDYGTGTGDGADFYFRSGAGGTTGGAGGNVWIDGGSHTGGTAGGVIIAGGAGLGTDDDGGNVSIRGGALNGAGAAGTVIIGDSNTDGIEIANGTDNPLTTYKGTGGILLGDAVNSTLFFYATDYNHAWINFANASNTLYIRGGNAATAGVHGGNIVSIAGIATTAAGTNTTGEYGGHVRFFGGRGANAGTNTTPGQEEYAGSGGYCNYRAGAGGNANSTFPGGKGGPFFGKGGYGGYADLADVPGPGGDALLVGGYTGNDTDGGNSATAGNAYVIGGDAGYDAIPGHSYICGGGLNFGSEYDRADLTLQGDVHIGHYFDRLSYDDLDPIIGRTRAIYISNNVDRPITTVYGHMKHEDYQVPVTGTAQSGDAGPPPYVQLAASDTEADDYYNGWTVDITGGTGSGQSNVIYDYNATTKYAYVVNAWSVVPASDSTYSLRHDFGVKVPTHTTVPTRTDAHMTTGDLVYDSGNDDLYAYTGTAWQKIGGATDTHTLQKAYDGGSAILMTAAKGAFDVSPSGSEIVAISLDSSNDSNLTMTANDAGSKTLTVRGTNSGAGTGYLSLEGDTLYVGVNNTTAIQYGSPTSATHLMYLDDENASAYIIRETAGGPDVDYMTFDTTGSAPRVKLGVDDTRGDDLYSNYGDNEEAFIGFLSTTVFRLATENGTTGYPVVLASGDITSGSNASGNVTVETGESQDTGDTGALRLLTGGQTGTAGETGFIQVFTGGITNSSSPSGDISVRTGFVTTGGGASGTAGFATGGVDGGSGNTGNVNLFTGSISNSGTGNSGQTNVYTGNITNGNGTSGAVWVRSGTTHAGGSGTTGEVKLYSGDASGTGNSGSVSIYAGSIADSGATAGSVTIAGGATTAGTANAGNIYLRGGNSTGGTDGAVVIGDSNTNSIDIGNTTDDPLTTFYGSSGILMDEQGARIKWVRDWYYSPYIVGFDNSFNRSISMGGGNAPFPEERGCRISFEAGASGPASQFGTAQSGTSNTIVLEAFYGHPDDDYYNGMSIDIYEGTGSGQTRTISDYVGSTGTATVSSAWTTIPDATSKYEIHVATPTGAKDGGACELSGSNGGNAGTASGETAGTGGTLSFGGGVGGSTQNTNTTNGPADGGWVRFLGGTGGSGGYGWAGGTGGDMLFRPGDGGPVGGSPESGTAQAGGASTITLAAAASTTDDYYNDFTIRISSGPGSGEIRTITDYVGATRVATVDSAWGNQPTSSSNYIIYPGGAGGDLYFTGGEAADGLLAAGDVHIAGGRSDFGQPGVHGTVYLGSNFQVNLGNSYYGRTDAIVVGNSTDRPSTYVYGHLRMEAYSAGETGTAQAGTFNSITLETGANAENGYYDSWTVEITSGTGSGQSRTMYEYNGTTKIAYVDPVWTTTPNATSVYSVYPNVGLQVPTVGAVPTRTDSDMLTGDLVYDSANDDLYAYTGTAWQLIGGGSSSTGNTLDQAYDEGGAGAGRSIAADSGAVQITGSGTSTEALDINVSGTIKGIDITQTGSGRVLQAVRSGNDVSDFAAVVGVSGSHTTTNPTPHGMAVDLSGISALTTNNPVYGYYASGITVVNGGTGAVSGYVADANWDYGFDTASDARIQDDVIIQLGDSVSAGHGAILGHTAAHVTNFRHDGAGNLNQWTTEDAADLNFYTTGNDADIIIDAGNGTSTGSDVLIDATAGVSIDGNAASNFTVDSANLTLNTTTSGQLILNSIDTTAWQTADKSSGAVATGTLTVETGEVSGTATTAASGRLDLASGNIATGSASSADTGDVWLHSGFTSDTGNYAHSGATGDVVIYSGAHGSTNATGATGAVNIYSGATAGSAGSTGLVSIFTGNSAGGTSGGIQLYTGSGSTAVNKGEIRVVGSRLIVDAHAANVGLRIPTNGAAPTDVTNSAIGDIVWDTGNNDLYVRSGVGVWTKVGGATAGDTLQTAYNAGPSITLTNGNNLDVNVPSSGTAAITLDANAASNFSVTGATLSLATLTGTAAGQEIDITAAAGAAGFAGGAIDLNAGAGTVPAAGAGVSGGAVTLDAGAGSDSAGDNNAGGTGGSITITAGAGGDADTGTANGGDAGDITLATAAGGAAASGGGNAGAAGDIILNPADADTNVKRVQLGSGTTYLWWGTGTPTSGASTEGSLWIDQSTDKLKILTATGPDVWTVVGQQQA